MAVPEVAAQPVVQLHAFRAASYRLHAAVRQDRPDPHEHRFDVLGNPHQFSVGFYAAEQLFSSKWAWHVCINGQCVGITATESRVRCLSNLKQRIYFWLLEVKVWMPVRRRGSSWRDKLV